jgi:hypothetical protein
MGAIFSRAPSAVFGAVTRLISAEPSRTAVWIPKRTDGDKIAVHGGQSRVFPMPFHADSDDSLEPHFALPSLGHHH